MSINLPISENAVLASTVHGFETINLELIKPEEAALLLAPGDFAVKNKVLPIRLDGETLVVAIGSPDSLQAADDLGVLTGRPVLPVLADPQLIKDKIDEFFLARLLQGLAGEDESATMIDEISDLNDLTRMADDSQVVGMVNAIFAQAVRDRASDIHIEPYEREVKVRIRIDGMLHELMRPPKRLHNAIVSRLKILGEMNIAERRLPQDGRIKLNLGGRSIDVRVSIVPTGFGERAVMRILDKSTAMLSLEELGFGSDVLERYRKLITIPYGIILATGPTGAGKSTTLYASLQEIYSPHTNILTIEDPVEYQVPGISQIQVRANIGLTFANGLRSFLRQDPDVIMVGEIRDHETGEIAIHAALTGHVVFSTLHTNDAAGAVTRLVDMGLEPFPRRLVFERRRRPASRSARLLELHGASQVRAGGAPRHRHPAGRDGQLHEGARLRAVQRHGLPGPRRPLRAVPSGRNDPADDRRTRAQQRDEGPRRGAPGDADPHRRRSARRPRG